MVNDALTIPPQMGEGGSLIGAELNAMFVIDCFIARGGMGEVYLARNKAGGDPVAIKILLPHLAADAAFLALFRQEAMLLERISHEALVKYRTRSVDPMLGLEYLVTEFVPGPSIAEVLTGRPVGPSTVRRVLSRLASGLAAAHAVDVIHRDLSPDNIILPGGLVERAKIVDFGIGKDLQPSRDGSGRGFAGKYGYASPEAFGRFGGKITPASDVYSLGLSILALARGSPVDMGQSLVEAIDKREDVPDLAGIDDALKPIFQSMLMPDPAHRLKTMGDVIQALDIGMPQVVPEINTGKKAAAVSPEDFARAPSPEAAVEAAAVAPLHRGLMIAAVLMVALAGAAVLVTDRREAPAIAETPPWVEAHPLVEQAIVAAGCADLRIGARSPDGQVAISGWRANSASLPEAVGGWTLDTKAVTVIEGPQAELCSDLAVVRKAVGEGRFNMPTMTTRIISGKRPLKIALPLNPAPKGDIWIMQRDDMGGSGPQWDALVAKPALDLSFKPIAGRKFIALVTFDRSPYESGSDSEIDAIRATCADGGCALATGWIELKPKP